MTGGMYAVKESGTELERNPTQQSNAPSTPKEFLDHFRYGLYTPLFRCHLLCELNFLTHIYMSAPL